MNELVIVDIDNTLVKGQSQNILLDYLYRRKIIGVFYFVKIYLWFILYRFGLVKNPKPILEYAVRFLKDKDVVSVERIIKKFVDTTLRHFFFAEALEIIRIHKKAGRKIILVSNAVDVLVKEISDLVAANDYIASALEIKDNVHTGKIVGQLVYGDRKLAVVKSYAEKHGEFSFKNMWVYADHYSDEKLLSAVGHPYAVNPDSGLKKIAIAKKWPILIFNLPQ